MSNATVGTVYQQIIERVIGASQNDFEEFGVDQSTLDEMKQGWQDKLSALKVAQFPWDPQPEPPRQPPTVPSNVKPEHELLPPVSAAQNDHVNFPNVPVKSERGYEPPLSTYPPAQSNGVFPENVAQQRAHALVAQRIHQNHPMPQHPQQHGGQMPMQQHPQYQQHQQYHHQQAQRMNVAQHQQQQQQQRPPQQMQQRPPPGNHYNPSQTDGSSDAMEDWKAMVAARRAVTDEERAEADHQMRARLDALVSRQDSGLMMPMSKMQKGKRRKAAVRVLQEEDAAMVSSASASAPAPARFDGEDTKDEEHDSDAINSELDDPEDDEHNGADSDDDMMDYMLCTYDKVQRVKNKWKCTLKDGILTTNKREYLFHKANGEFEW